ncbi:MAG: hypothetical protein ABJD07_06465 [Gemmatimonadaceae bacterium]
MSEAPKHLLEWYLHEPEAVARISRVLPAMALATGIAVRVWRDVLLASSSSSSWIYLIVTYIGQAVILLSCTAAHLGNYPLKRWLWRAPVFAVLTGAAEAGASWVLIAMHYERLGTDYAHSHEWAGLAVLAVGSDVVLIIVFAILLAIVMQVIRFALLKRDHRAHTVAAVHEERVRVTKELETPKI